MTRRAERWDRWALAITLAAFALYAFRLGSTPLRGDEAFTAIFGRWSMAEMLGALRTTEPHPPLYYVLIRYWIKPLGSSELALRFPSFLAGVLLVPLTYALGKRWGDPRAGLWGGALVALSPFLIWHGQDARMYTLLAALGLASLWLGLLLLTDKRPRARGLWAGYVCITLAALATHYYALFVLAAQNLFFLFALAKSWPDRPATRRWITAQGTLAILSAPWFLYATGFMLGHSKDWISSLPLLAFLRRLAVTFTVGLTFPDRLGWLWALAFAALLALGIARSLKATSSSDPAATAMLLLGLLAPIAATFVISLRRPVFDERYLITCVPIYFLFVGKGLSAWQGRWRLVPWALGAMLALGPAYALYQYHEAPQHAKSPDWRGALDHVAARVEPGDLLILNYPDPTQEYYNAGRVPYALLPWAFPVGEAATRARLAQLGDEHPRIWLVPTRAENWDRHGLVEGWLGRYADLVEEAHFRGLRVQLYHTEMRYRQAMRPVDATLGAGLRLRGFDLWADGERITSEPVARPGSLLLLKLYWEALEPVEADYTVFTHLMAPDGTLKGQKDAPPLDGSYGTSQWQQGEALVDRYPISIDPNAPPGRYQLVMGMYLWPSMEHLPIRDSAGQPLGQALPLAEIQIAGRAE